MVRRVAAGVTFLGAVLALGACGVAAVRPPTGATSTALAPASTNGPGSTTATSVANTIANTIASTVTSASGPPAQLAFVGTSQPVTAAALRYTWHPGCPVGPSQLRMLTMSYWGFDGRRHSGTMVVNSLVVPQVLQVFRSLYHEHFPIRSMVPEDAFGGHDPLSMAADNTSGFNCRYAVTVPPSRDWSEHAYGLAIDVNPVENPYLEGSVWQPAAGAAFSDRSDVRPGMAVAGGPLVEAFAAVGWYWGGRWTASPDYQHFSENGN